MVKVKSEVLDATYHALANATRRKILTRLAKEGTLSIQTLSEPFDLTLAGVSKHIKVLAKAGLITKTKSATNILCSFNPEPIKTAGLLIDFLEDPLESSVTLTPPPSHDNDGQKAA